MILKAYHQIIKREFINLFRTFLMLIYSKAINKKYNRTGSLFQEHLHRIKVNSEEYFKQLLLYIHLNPEKHEICEIFSDYKHSSYNSFIINKPSLLNRKEVFDYFDSKDNFIKCHMDKKINLELLKEIDNWDG